MKMTRTRLFCFVLTTTLLICAYATVDTTLHVTVGHAAAALRQPSQSRPPVLIIVDSFGAEEWAVSAVTTEGASYTVEERTSGGLAGSPAFGFMSHRLPPVVGDGLAIVQVTQVYSGTTYNPGTQGAISAIDYDEWGRILSFPFPEAFVTSQPVVLQDGRIYRSTRFVRFIAEFIDGEWRHEWESQSLDGLTAADFVAVDGDEDDHPDFSAAGGVLRFGFTRSNSRGSTQPPVPADEDMVVDHGVDRLQLIIRREIPMQENRPPQAVDDIFVLDGNMRSLPLLDFFDVVRNDSDPDRDRLEITEVTEPLHGSAGELSDHTVVYQLTQPRSMDAFNYTISDGEFTSSAEAQVLVDCACTVTCLSTLELPEHAATAQNDGIDLPLIYRVRDQVLKPTPDGRRYVEMYYRANTEMLANIIAHEPLRVEAVATVVLWQEALRSLVDGDGSATMTQAQVDALDAFLEHLSELSSDELQEVIAAERARLGSLDAYVGLSVKEAKRRAIGDASLNLPLIHTHE